MSTIPTAADRITTAGEDLYPEEDVVVGDRIRIRRSLDTNGGPKYGDEGVVVEPSRVQVFGEITVEFPTGPDGALESWFVRTRNHPSCDLNEFEICNTELMPTDALPDEETEDDPVNPRHYADLGEYAAIYVIEKWRLGFNLGQVLKYIQRAGSKPGEPELRDLEKARWYLDRHLHELDPEKHLDPAAV